MSTHAGQSLFNSGPHRFAPRSMGRLWVPPLTLDTLQDLTTVFTTNLEVSLRQTGRLIGSSESDLWSQVETIRARCEAKLFGTLVDNAGRSWVNMTLLTFRPADRADRGRVISLAYTADYVRLG